MSLYDDATLVAAVRAAYGGVPCQPISFEVSERDIIDALDAAAPLIAAKALRDFANERVSTQSPARLMEDLHARADEIERGGA